MTRKRGSGKGLYRPVPVGFDVIDLPEADYLMFQGEPFAEEDYREAITNPQQAMNGYDPSVIGCAWDDTNPRIQLEPRGNHGYIELRKRQNQRRLAVSSPVCNNTPV